MNDFDAWARHAHAANGFGDAAAPLTPARNRSRGTAVVSGPGDAASTGLRFAAMYGRLDMIAGDSIMAADSPRRHYCATRQRFLSLLWPPHYPTPLC